MFRAGLKAGIIMGIVLTVDSVIPHVIGLWFPGGQLPPSLPPEYEWVFFLMAALTLLIPLLWFVAGILAARFGAAAALSAAAAAGAGALAGAITEIIHRIAGVVMNLIWEGLGLVSVTEPPGAPTTVEKVAPCICVALSMAIAAGLGALGGIVGRAVSRRRRA